MLLRARSARILMLFMMSSSRLWDREQARQSVGQSVSQSVQCWDAAARRVNTHDRGVAEMLCQQLRVRI